MNPRIAGPLLLASLAAPAFAADYTDSAPVVSSVPVYQTISEPAQQCWTEPLTTYEQRRSPAGVLLGGVAGGLLGNTVGRGNGRVASTVVGALVGAAVGDHLANRDNPTVAITRPVQRCQAVQTYRQVVTGYQVTYNYNGRYTTVLLPYDPGPRVPVDVGVTGAQVGYAPVPVARLGYESYAAPVWVHRPHKHRRHERDWDR